MEIETSKAQENNSRQLPEKIFEKFRIPKFFAFVENWEKFFFLFQS
jgi:hypothetical protein